MRMTAFGLCVCLATLAVPVSAQVAAGDLPDVGDDRAGEHPLGGDAEVEVVEGRRGAADAELARRQAIARRFARCSIAWARWMR